MGMFDFLKKDKSSTDAGMDLPPVPKIEGIDGTGLPEPGKTPDLPDSSLPPLPTDVPGAVPPAPTEEKLEAPKMDLPPPPALGAEPDKPPMELPELPPEEPAIPETPAAEPKPPAVPETPEKPELPAMPAAPVEDKPPIPEAPKPEFPPMPAAPGELVPDKIPPLEGLPEAPAFEPEEFKPAPLVEEPVLPEQPMYEPADMPKAADFSPAEFVPAEKHEPVRRDIRGPMFIRTDRFKAIIEDIEHVKSRFTDEDDIFSRIGDVKSSQDKIYENYRQTLEDIQRKLLFIDRSLFEGK